MTLSKQLETIVNYMYLLGAYQNYENFGLNLGPPLEVFKFDPSHRSDRNLPLHFDELVHFPSLVYSNFSWTFLSNGERCIEVIPM